MTRYDQTSRLAAGGYTLLWAGLWLAMMAAALKLRPFLPVDETRYLAVAWEMWRDGNFLVPHLNGEAYSHKPPLLFWLMHAGWAVFGVNDWWPRLVAPLFGLVNLLLTAQLARRLWPTRPAVAIAAPLILLGSIFWTLFTTLTMFDMLLAFCALLGMLGIIRAWQDDSTAGFVWLALAIGIGALAKGPAILLSVLPVALLAPLWSASLKPREPEIEIIEADTDPQMWSRGWKQWYICIGFAVLGGIAIGLIWAIPAAIMGGEEYRDAIFWGQSAGRMVNSFAHSRPWWWFLAVLPGLLLPWTVWPACWRALAGLLELHRDNALRFCLVWFLPALLTFSAISGKQLHYLLPVFPALALIAARLLVDQDEDDDTDTGSWKQSGLQLPGGFFVGFGVLLLVAPFVAGVTDLPDTVAELDFIWGAALAAFALAVIFVSRAGRSLLPRIAALAVLSAALVVSIHLSLKPVLDERFDLRPISEKLGQWQRDGIKLAYSGKYHGQFNYMGRLIEPITRIGRVEGDIQAWIEENPGGHIIAVTENMPDFEPPLYTQPYRGRTLTVISAAQALAKPAILEKP